MSERVVPNTARLYDRAMDLYRKGRLQDAEKLYKDLLRLDPTFSDALNDLGVIYIQQKNFAEAKECFEKAIQLQPNTVEPYYNLACLHSIKGELQEGLMQLNQAIALNPAVKDWVENDPDMVNLKGVPDFKDILKDQTHD
jgi:superkiller protein 3